MSLYPYNPGAGQKIQSDVKDIRLDMGFIAHYLWANPVAAAVDNVLGATALAAGQVTEITENITNPDVPRAVQIKGNQAGVAGNVVIEGTNINDEIIQETIEANGANAVEGNKAFKTITKITLPQQVGAGDTISVGCTDKLGLPYKLAADTVLVASLNHVREGTAPTVGVDAINIEGNTVDLNSALNGSQVDVWLIV